MAVILIPRPSRKSYDPERDANALLLSQVDHLQHAENRLPLRYRSRIYTHAIRTEGEAAKYIREVTEAIRKAHADARADRAKRKQARKRKTTRQAERPKSKRK